MVLNYRRCSLRDIERLRKIAKETFKTAFEKENNPADFKAYMNTAFAQDTMLAQLTNTLSHFYFVYKENILIGYFKLNEGGAQTEIKKDDFIELERIYVLSEYQRKGIGTQIIANIKSMARAKQKSTLWLGVWEHNKRAIKFYQEHKFRKFSTHPYFIGNDEQTDWLMRCDLSIL